MSGGCRSPGAGPNKRPDRRPRPGDRPDSRFASVSRGGRVPARPKTGAPVPPAGAAAAVLPLPGPWTAKRRLAWGWFPHRAIGLQTRAPRRGRRSPGPIVARARFPEESEALLSRGHGARGPGRTARGPFAFLNAPPAAIPPPPGPRSSRPAATGALTPVPFSAHAFRAVRARPESYPREKTPRRPRIHRGAWPPAATCAN